MEFKDRMSLLRVRVFNSKRSWIVAAVLVVLVALGGLAGSLLNQNLDSEDEEEGMAKGHDRTVAAAVVQAPSFQPVTASPLTAGRFSTQTRLGYTSGDQWEPAIAADRYGHIYVLYPQYGGVPGCPACPSPTMILQVSNDHGSNWESPRQIASPGTGQWDPQIVVDPADGRTVYAAWLQNNKSDVAVAKSSDFGATWSVVVANASNSGSDKPILTVNGKDVYVIYTHAQKLWVSFTHSWPTFTSVSINPSSKVGWSMAGGGTIAKGNVYFSMAGYQQNGQAKGPVNLYVSKSADGGTTWTSTLLDVSGSPPDCSAYSCGWAFLGAQITMASDDAGTLYALWNAGTVDKGTERIYFSKSTDEGKNWSSKMDVSTATGTVSHAFPAIVAGAAGDVRIAWMDTRAGSHWNTLYRSSTNGGTTWSAESVLSTYVSGYSYIFSDGFSFPFGDYFEMSIDGDGITHAVWGEGLNYKTPGSIWYSRGK